MESKLRFLRDCLENQLTRSIYDRFWVKQNSLQVLDSTGGPELCGLFDSMSLDVQEIQNANKRADFTNSVSPVLIFSNDRLIYISLPTPLRMLSADKREVMEFIRLKLERYMQNFSANIVRAPD